jgi:SnoaL-like domain
VTRNGEGEAGDTLQRILDWHDIYEVLCRYARGVDRGDWELVRSTYHPDAYDDHVGYQGNVDGLIEWLTARFAGVDNSVHFLGNCLVERADGGDSALVETYFVSSRLRPTTEADKVPATPEDAICRQSWGRYVDRFERRDGVWKVARREVVIDAGFTSLALGGARSGGRSWGMRNAHDPLHRERRALGITS